jgi:hypothetical protein
MFTMQLLLFLTIILAISTALSISIIASQRQRIRGLSTNRRTTENAITLISDERKRQQVDLGWTAEHDDKAHAHDSFLLNSAMDRIHRDNGTVDGLVKTAALIAAEIDRRMRANRRNAQARVARRGDHPAFVAGEMGNVHELPKKSPRSFLSGATLVESFDYGNVMLGIDEGASDGDMTSAALVHHEGRNNVSYLDHVQVPRGEQIPPIVGHGKAARFARRTDLLPGQPPC